MSRFIILCRKGLEYAVFDMQDSTIECIDEASIEFCKKERFDIGILASSNHPFGLKTDENKYAIFLPNGRRIYGDSFPTENDRNDLIDHRISIRAVGRFSKYIVIAITCDCFCKYDIELPMSMVHLVGVEAHSLKDAGLVAYTEMPVHFTDDALSECRECGGEDYPFEWCVPSKFTDIIIDRNRINVMGVLISNELPFYMNLSEKIQYTKVEFPY